MRMSNSQPCQAQRSISPTRERLESPGSSELQVRDARRLGQWRALVRAAVEEREKLAVDVKHDDLAAIDR